MNCHWNNIIIQIILLWYEYEWMISDSGDDEDTLEKEGGDTHNAGWLKSASLFLYLNNN